MFPTFQRASGTLAWTMMGAGAVAAGAFLGTWVRRVLAPADGHLQSLDAARDQLLGLEQRLEHARNGRAQGQDLETLVGERLSPALAVLEDRLDRQQAALGQWQAQRRKTHGKLKKVTAELDGLRRRGPRPC
jgi:hypothetical protein